MNRNAIVFFTLFFGSLAAGCDGSKPPVTPNMPALGTQMDRMGRAGVNTALTDPFDIVQGKTEDQVKDDYNADANVATWTVTWKANIATSLAILDALDGKCGNQILACGKPAGCGTDMPMAGRYDTLATALADDQIYVNTAASTCNAYLAVEANATNILANNDCGGRTPLYDTIQVTYSALAAGMLSGITSGVTVDADGQASLTAFPFLSDPN